MAVYPRQNDPPITNSPDSSFGPTILALCATMVSLAAIAVMTRMYVRIRMTRSVGLDDYTMILAMALSLTGLGLIITEVSIGAGRHASFLSTDTLSICMLYTFVIQLVYLWAITIVKTSITFFLIRFAPSKNFRFFLQVLIGFLLAYATTWLILQMIQCIPLSTIWDSNTGGSCLASVPTRLLNYVDCSISLVVDVILALLPIQMLRNVQVKPRVKLAISGIMSLGTLAAIASMIKLHYILTYGDAGDLIYNYSNLTIWTVVECNIGIIAASLSCMRPLVKKFLGPTGTYASKETEEVRQEGQYLCIDGVHYGKPIRLTERSLLQRSRRKTGLIAKLEVGSSSVKRLVPEDSISRMYAHANRSIAQADQKPRLPIDCMRLELLDPEKSFGFEMGGVAFPRNWRSEP